MTTSNNKTRLLLLGILYFSLSGSVLLGQKKYSIRGVVYEKNSRTSKEALPGVTLFLPTYGVGTVSDFNGNYQLQEVPEGKVQLQVSFIGKVTIDTLLSISSDMQLNFVMHNDNFRLKEIVVTAKPGGEQSGQSTSSTISSKAMEHLQSASLENVMALLPGGITSNPTLNYASQINIRSINESNLNALGSAIIQDGAPISNNANLQTMNPAVVGNLAGLSGLASPAGGFDTRAISLENIESVEVIRGIPSVEYGDLTSGAVLVKSKAGRTPLNVKMRANPNVYQLFAQKGVRLGKKRGDLNLSADYAYNTNNPVESYKYYQRFTTKLFYSNAFLDNRWKSNTIVDFMFGKDNRDLNPDDKISERMSSGKDARLSLNTNGIIYLNKLWLKNIKYTLLGSYADKKSHFEQLYVAANAPYSMTTVDGAVIANKPNFEILDTDGNKVTDYTGVEPSHHAVFLPSTYKGVYDICGKEISAFTKLSGTFFKRFAKADNRFMIGAEYRFDANVGKGKTFDPLAPPYRNLQALNASFRPREYKDIPFLHHGVLYIEENLTARFLPQHVLRLQAGLRYDMMKDVKHVLSPRINASIELFPKKIFLRGGYGITAKMPTLAYLYPEKAYFEYININEMANDKIPEAERVFMTTTRIFDTKNKLLKAANNRKAEVGMDFIFDKARLYLTAYRENLKNGYSMTPVYKPVAFNEYSRVGNGSKPIYELTASHPVLAEYFTPSNHLVMNGKGIEFDLKLNRIDAIRTSFSFSGAYMQNENYSDSYTYYDNSGEGGASRTHVALYEPSMSKHISERFSTALRATHNIPEIGFVVTLTAETIWNERDRYLFGNDTIPIAYISKHDGLQYDFDPAKKDEPEFRSIIRQREDSKYITETFPPLFNFNINLTKDIRDFMRVSFFANNMFRSYPIAESKRHPGKLYKRNKSFFFGLEVNILIR